MKVRGRGMLRVRVSAQARAWVRAWVKLRVRVRVRARVKARTKVRVMVPVRVQVRAPVRVREVLADDRPPEIETNRHHLSAYVSPPLANVRHYQCKRL